MKLCPQCDFIYEDDQSFCDMDGRELVLKFAAEAPRFRLTIPFTPPGKAAALEVESPARRSNSVALAAVVVLVLAALVVAAYVARTRQTRARRAVEPAHSALQVTDQSTQSSAQTKTTEPSRTDAATEQTPVGQSPASASSEAEQSSKVSLAHSRLSAGQVAALASSSNSRGPVFVRLTNGATIRADEAWEKREGVWYRQGGVVTFLKRSQVRAIERPANQNSTQAVTATTAAVNRKQAANRDQLRIAQLPPAKRPAETKKDSRVTSFLKKTGRIIKKPFKF